MISTIINPYWKTLFYQNANDHAKVSKPNAHFGILSTIGCGVHTTRSLLFDKFILHVLSHDISKTTQVSTLHLIPFSLAPLFILHLDINVIHNSVTTLLYLYFPIIHLYLFSLDNTYLNIYVYLVHLGQNPKSTKIHINTCDQKIIHI